MVRAGRQNSTTQSPAAHVAPFVAAARHGDDASQKTSVAPLSRVAPLLATRLLEHRARQSPHPPRSPQRLQNDDAGALRLGHAGRPPGVERHRGGVHLQRPVFHGAKQLDHATHLARGWRGALCRRLADRLSLLAELRPLVLFRLHRGAGPCAAAGGRHGAFWRATLARPRFFRAATIRTGQGRRASGDRRHSGALAGGHREPVARHFG